VDDRPYGGGAGMVMMAPPIVEAVESVLGDDLDSARVLLMSAAGVRFDQGMAEDLAGAGRVAIVCGHYEGIDQRAVEILKAEEVSLGDFVLTGGEIPAMAIVDAVARLIPGVIRAESIEEESHAEGLVEYPQFTRPVAFRGQTVPAILLSGHHGQIREWRQQAAEERHRRRDALEAQRRTIPGTPNAPDSSRSPDSAPT
jgi:tRNA (guanine37-N1)-methyltransferase